MDHFSWVPHGYCFNWNPYLLWSLVSSDVLIAIAYFAIPLSLLYYSRQLFHSQAFPLRFYQIIGLFCAFIVCCGISHIAEVITVFLPLYSLSVAAKAVTAIVSLVAALWLPPFAAQAIALVQSSQANQAGLEQHQLIRDLFIDSSPYPIYCKRASDSTMIWLNRACERAIARPASSVIGLNDTNFLKDEEQAARILQNDRLVAENGEAEFIEVVPDATGQPREYYTRKFRFTDPHTNELCIGGFSLDVTDQQIAQGKLIAANEKLREKETRLSLMVLNLNLISELSVRLNLCDSYQEAGDVVRVAGRKLFPYLAGELFLIDNSRSYAERRFSWGSDAGSKAGFMPNECRSLKEAKVHYCEDQETEMVCEHLHKPVSGSHLCVPLFSYGRETQTLGVLHLRRDRPLTNVEIEIAEIVGQQLGQALSALSDRKAAQEMLIRDSLTNLYNENYLKERLQQEILRCKRLSFANPCPQFAFLMLDIDHFKRINDGIGLGHDVGDYAIKSIAHCLRQNTRGEDVVARLHGDELVVALFDVDQVSAIAKAETLCSSIRQLNIVYGNTSLPTITVSIGVALYPENGTDFDELYKSADRAMYQSKKEGRDRVSLAG